MTFVVAYQCTICHKVFSPDARYTCDECGEDGILDVIYDYEAMKTVVTKTYFKTQTRQDIFRYLPLMSVDATHIDKTLRVGMTPLYKAHHLEQKFNIDALYIKDEGVNPSASLKDRASVVAVLKALEYDHQTIACSSTGNAASSLAAHAARLGLKSVIFVPKRAPFGKLRQMIAYGARVLQVDGDYKAAYRLSKAAIDKYGWYNRNAAINPHMVEGKKTVAYELYEDLGYSVPDWVVVSVGDGCTIAGLYKGFYDLKMLGLINTVPKLLGVQSTGCNPFVTSFQTGHPLKETEEDTLADSIAVGKPRNPVKGMNAVHASNGAFIEVSDQAILASMRLLGKTEGLFGEPAGVTSLAGLIEALSNNIIKQTDTVVLLMTGNGLKDPKNAEKALGKPTIIPEAMDKLNNVLDESEDTDE